MVIETVRGLYEIAIDRELTVLAAAFAYYAFVSLIPLVLLALVVSSIIGGEEVAARLVDVAGEAMPGAGEDLLELALTAESGRAQATVLALVVASWGALKVFRGLSVAFDRIYGTVAEKTFVDHLVDGVTTLLVVALGLLLMVVIGIFLGIAAAEIPFGWLLGWIGLFAGLFVIFAALYYVLPPISVSVRHVLPGATFAALGWVLLQFGFQIYAGLAGQYEAYGAVGAVIIFVTWLYFAGIVILFGAVLNVVLAASDAEHTADEDLDMSL